MQDSIFMESAAKWFDALAPEVVRKPPLPRWRCVTISHLAVAVCANDWPLVRGAVTHGTISNQGDLPDHSLNAGRNARHLTGAVRATRSFGVRRGATGKRTHASGD